MWKGVKFMFLRGLGTCKSRSMWKKKKEEQAWKKPPPLFPFQQGAKEGTNKHLGCCRGEKARELLRTEREKEREASGRGESAKEKNGMPSSSVCLLLHVAALPLCYYAVLLFGVKFEDLHPPLHTYIRQRKKYCGRNEKKGGRKRAKKWGRKRKGEWEGKKENSAGMRKTTKEGRWKEGSDGRKKGGWEGGRKKREPILPEGGDTERRIYIIVRLRRPPSRASLFPTTYHLSISICNGVEVS